MKKFYLKRIFDIVLSGLGLIVSLPLGVVIILFIMIKSGRPIFYLQERVGKNGIIFKVIKFRTMIKDAEKGLGPIQAEINDQRVTAVGKILRVTALDELPQLFNILKGDMSFVGPRALRPVESEVGKDSPESIYEFEGFKERLSILPGLTGIAQIFAPRDICRREKFRYDIWYIKNKNILMDMKLIMFSFLITFLGRWELDIDKLHILGKFKGKIESNL